MEMARWRPTVTIRCIVQFIEMHTIYALKAYPVMYVAVGMHWAPITHKIKEEEENKTGRIVGTIHNVGCWTQMQ